MSRSVEDVALMSAVDLVAAFRSGALSPVEATEAALAQIDRHEATVNAWCLVDRDGALSRARASEERWARDEPAGPLDGVTVAVKDVFLTEGWPTLKGSGSVDPNQRWNDDAPVVASLRRAGAVLVGKVTTPELGWKGVTDSPVYGVTRNPWDPTRTPGGSSGGSSVAVTLGMSALALGTDGGGSIRIPAGFCGHPGFKPTYGRIPLWPPSPYGTLAHAGPMARTVDDLALMMNVIAQPDARDWTALPPDGTDYLRAARGDLAGARIAFSPDLGYVDVDPEVAEAVARAAETFQLDLGADVEVVAPGFADPLDTYATLWNAGAATTTAGWTSEQRAAMDPGLARIIEAGKRCSAGEYLAAAQDRAHLGVLMSRFHQRFDLLLTPTLPIPAFEAGRDVPEHWPDDRWPTWTPFTYPFNLTQQPAASVPCGVTREGLPIGLQIVGPKYAASQVLRAARAFLGARPFTDRPAMLDA